jgi:hypothetical protein
MTNNRLRISEGLQFESPRLVMGFSGWMNGGDVSTGTIRVLTQKLGAKRFARGLLHLQLPGWDGGVESVSAAMSD